jgi:hypothetical protein
MSTLPMVIAWGQADFSAEELCEMARVGVTHPKDDIHYALLRFAEQSPREVHPQKALFSHAARV